MATIGKIKVDTETYDIKDLYLREQVLKAVNTENPIFDGSPTSTDSSASGDQSIAIGSNNLAEGEFSSTFGNSVTASGRYSHAEGDHTTALGVASHAEGQGTYDEATNSWIQTTASGDASHAEGKQTVASGDHSHSEGCETVASGHASHAEGCTNIAAASYSHVEGKNNAVEVTKDSENNDLTGLASHVEGNGNIARSSYAHVEGENNVAGVDARGVHISGRNNIAAFENNLLVVGQYNQNQSEDIFEFGNGYVDTDNNNTIVQQNAIRITNDNKMYIDLDDVLFYGKIQGVMQAFSLMNAVLVDSELDNGSIHPVQNKAIAEEMNRLFTCVSEGKNKLKNALADLGVEVVVETGESSPTFDALVEGIKSLSSGVTENSKYLFVRDSTYTIAADETGDKVFPAPLPITKTVPLDGSFVNFFTVQTLS